MPQTHETGLSSSRGTSSNRPPSSFSSVTFMPALEPDRYDLVPRPTRFGGFESSETSPRRINLVPA
ncbi:hypothetical protein PGT21_007732 [Puccinia graminis f. sp. tritici]|uniref:Uncharacterized protein n=1 Tax=Puccinia graminis f. sp. tritici TaxID=56615 RepID=A0A5B0S0Y4_PUCGR|nr:hypothetical protein PGT21_007732 [Puccinia graminis f. sp. tritici]KAA1131412.1 hypothetical protein PGTUg99_005558 [Puccinia graminis f. sp. tritici]